MLSSHSDWKKINHLLLKNCTFYVNSNIICQMESTFEGKCLFFGGREFVEESKTSEGKLRALGKVIFSYAFLHSITLFSMGRKYV